MPWDLVALLVSRLKLAVDVVAGRPGGSPSGKNLSSPFGSADLLGRPLCRLLRRLCNAEVFKLFAGFDCCREPARRQSAAGPGFARIFGIAVFRGNGAADPEPFGMQLGG